MTNDESGGSSQTPDNNRKCNVCCIWILLFVYPSNQPSENIQASFPFNLIGHLNKSLIYIYTSFTSCKLLRTTSCCTLYGILIYRFYCVKVDSRYIHAVCCAVLAALWDMEWDGRFGKVLVVVSALRCSNITLNQFCSICDNVTMFYSPCYVQINIQIFCGNSYLMYGYLIFLILILY